jgi:hypothetical protein
MKRNIVMALILVLLTAAGAIHPVLAEDDISEALAQVRHANTQFHSTSVAMAAGYNLVPGLDYCFTNPGVGGMGFHLINTSLLDTVINPLKPEALVYAPERSGKWDLVAVEYIVPIAAWDAAHSKPPRQFGQTYERNTALGVYTLHAWIFKHNPLGMFNDWNPTVTCNPK